MGWVWSEAAMEQALFTIVPNDIWLDPRLSKTDLRVLGAILSFRAKNTNIVWPSRAKIGERTGLPETKISVATGRLVRLGWLEKEGKGGFSKATRYLVKVPELGSTTVPESVTVTDSVTVTESVTKTVTEPVTRIEQTNEQTNTLNKGGRKRFVEPTVEQVQAYCQERNNNIDAERFVDFYTAKGWMLGKNKMKDWKAAVRTWEKRNHANSSQPSGISLAERATRARKDFEQQQQRHERVVDGELVGADDPHVRQQVDVQTGMLGF
jgi:hypothetical protein